MCKVNDVRKLFLVVLIKYVTVIRDQRVPDGVDTGVMLNLTLVQLFIDCSVQPEHE